MRHIMFPLSGNKGTLRLSKQTTTDIGGLEPEFLTQECGPRTTALTHYALFPPQNTP